MTKTKHIHQFLRFGIAGIAGFLVDAGILEICIHNFRLTPILSQAIAFGFAVTTTWIINRCWTFSEYASTRWTTEFSQYVLTNSIGAAVNNSIYIFLVIAASFFRNNPVLAVSIGSISGMLLNFTSSKKFVFKTTNNAK